MYLILEISSPLSIVHIFSVLSLLALANIWPLGLKAREEIWSECPDKVLISWLVSTSQSLIVLSWLPLIKVFPSGLNAREVIPPNQSECPLNVLTWFSANTKILMVLSIKKLIQNLKNGEMVCYL